MPMSCCFCDRSVLRGERGACCPAARAFAAFIDALRAQEGHYFAKVVHKAVREATRL